MVKRKQRKAKKKPAVTVVMKRKAPPRSLTIKPGRIFSAASAWEALLRDPCAGNLAYPCYSGADSGYLIRTMDTLTPGFPKTATAGTAVVGDYFLAVTPSSYTSHAYIIASGTNGGSMGATVVGTFGANFLASSVVKRFRPVASCLKWIPSGAYNNRAGVVGMGYSTGRPLSEGENIPGVSNVLPLCQRLAPNGSEMHEVRWLPTSVDENFTNSAVEVPQGGTMIAVLRGVDGIEDNTGTTATFNGYFEVYTVWEWVPDDNASISVAPKAPLPFTSQQVLSTIGDMGTFLFKGVRSAGRGLVRDAAESVMLGLSRGVGSINMRGPSIPYRLTY